MGVDERARHELYQRLETTLGQEATDTLMTYLPPVGWADVATKTDLENLRVATKTDLETLEYKVIGVLHRELNAQTKTIIFSVMSAQVAIGGLALALSRLAS